MPQTSSAPHLSSSRPVSLSRLADTKTQHSTAFFIFCATFCFPRIMSHFPSTQHTLRTPFIFREKKPPRPFPLDPLILTTRRASFTPQSSFFLHFPQKEADSHIKSLSSVHCCRPHKSLPCLCVAGKRHVPFHSPRRLVIMAFLTQEHLTMPKEEWFQTSA